MHRMWCLFLFLLAGCNTIEITSFREDNKKVLIQEILDTRFTPPAVNAIQHIRIYEGLHIHSYVVGVNFWSNLAGFLTFNGVGRKIITSQGTLHESETATIIHEYTHHLDDMDRDGEFECINHLEFWRAFLVMRADPALYDETEALLNKADRTITNIFGIGPLSELIAYTATWVVSNPDKCPAIMHRALAGILQISASKVGGS